MELNIIDNIIKCIFKKYTYKIYCLGMKDGYNWISLGGRCPQFVHER